MDATVSDPLVGRVLDGRYVVDSRIARGGMATVYLATDRRLDRDVAVKVMHPHLADDEQFVARFIREAKSAARLSHPNVVSVFDQGSDTGTVFLAMEHLPGRTLRDVLRARGPLSPAEAFDVLEPVLDALGAAHRAGIVHRDIKPENVLLTDDGRVKVADFGLARAASTAATASTGVLIGTVAYLSPELVERGVADARSDVYGAGILLFEMLTGRQPYEGDVAIQVAYRHVHDDVPAPSSLDAGIAPQLDELVRRATARDPDERPADAGEMLAEVRRTRRELSPQALARRPERAGGMPLSQTLVVDRLPAHDGRVTQQDTAPATDWGYGPDGRRRRRGALGLVAVLVLALLLGGVAWYLTAGPGGYLSTPDVVGQTRSEAESELTRAGLGFRVQEEFHDVAPAGEVVATDPAAGQDVRRSSPVVLVVSAGPELFAVPDDVVGVPLEDARAAVTEANLTVAEPVAQEYSADVEAGRVVSATPAPGTELRRGEAVSLVVSRGPQPVDVPPVVGQPSEAAVQALAEAGLGAEVVEQTEFDNEVPAGAVLRQTPADGQLLPGEVVTLVLSQGPDLVVVPPVQGLQLDVARSELEAAGFQVDVERVLGGVFGTVRSSSPEGGTSAVRGSTVTLTIV